MDKLHLGWLQAEEDIEYLRSGITFSMPTVTDAPKSFDPRDWLQVEQQGELGSCAGHASTTASEICEFIETKGDKIQLSRGFAYIMGQRESRIIGDRGATITGVVKSLKENGICLEETYPYIADYQQLLGITTEAKVEAKQHRIRNHSYLTSYNQCLNFLQAGQGAIIIGVAWTKGLADNQNGIIDTRNSRGNNLGGHAVCLCGWVASEKENPWLILANSHGHNWGNGGFAICSPNWIEQNTRDRGSEFIGISDLSTNFNQPRSFDFIKNWMQD